jgi:hypothetical protein
MLCATPCAKEAICVGFSLSHEISTTIGLVIYVSGLEFKNRKLFKLIEAKYWEVFSQASGKLSQASEKVALYCETASQYCETVPEYCGKLSQASDEASQYCERVPVYCERLSHACEEASQACEGLAVQIQLKAVDWRNKIL